MSVNRPRGERADGSRAHADEDIGRGDLVYSGAMKHLLAFLVLVGCGAGTPPTATPPPTTTDVAADFTMICAEAERALAQLAGDARATAFATAVTARLRTPAARNTFEAAGMEPGDRKEAALAQGAAESGIPGWTCPAITTLYGSR